MPGPLDASPPCIVLGLETQIGLGIVRELGRAGVKVIGIAQSEDAIGLASRHLFRGLVVPDARSQRLLQVLRGLGETWGPCPLIAVSEVNLQWLAAHRNELGQVQAIVPEVDKLSIVLDKQKTLDIAREVGIQVPTSIEPMSMNHLRDLAKSFRFPGVMKWKDPNSVAAPLSALGLEVIKAEYVYSPAQLLEIASRYEPMGLWPVLQSYCPGLGLGQFFFMHKGEAIQRFQHVRVAEWPPEGGFSAVCDAVPLHKHTVLQQQSIELLRRIGWEGIAMVEYRWDPTSQQAVLMEINGRYWGSYPLAVHCRADFALTAYRVTVGQQLQQLPKPATGKRCRMVGIELKRLRRILLQRDQILDRAFAVQPAKEIWRFLSDFLRPSVCYYLWDLDDPRPFWQDLRNLFVKMLRQR